jgi:ERCC4-type nuclease
VSIPKRKTRSKELVILIDDREKKPYRWAQIKTERKRLPVGDYSIKGLEHNGIIIERKTLSEVPKFCGTEKENFERRVRKMSQFKRAYIIIETSMHKLLAPYKYSQLPPQKALNQLISWSTRFNVTIWLADDRRHAQRLTLRILERYWAWCNIASYKP